MAYAELSPTELAVVITYLEMVERPRLQDMPAAPFRLQHWERPDAADYLRLFRQVGQNWLWVGRLTEAEAEVAARLIDPRVTIHVVLDEAGAEVGMLEIDFRVPGQATIAYVGLVPEQTGQGHGRWLLGQALALAWRDGISQVLVNTNNHDHPAALRSYLKIGFRPYARVVATFQDPRLSGLLPREAAPQIPIIEHPRRFSRTR